ncbi:hypothetical protein HW132_35145, partial [Brasilonema sp. CT11]|nr:hypothetical protein [Brasilonema sp. CT11]
PGDEPGQYVITPTYDALGGYLIATSIITKNKKDYKFEWLKQKDFIDSFVDEGSHQLSFDIFKSLVALFPRRYNGQQLWKVVPDIFRNAALRLISELDSELLDQNTVDALKKLMYENIKARNDMFARLQKIRLAQNHPLNANFLDSFLCALPMEDRDLSWSEWLRKNKKDCLNDLLHRESMLKENLSKRNSLDKLQIKWFKWYLTSTDHELRDHATRMLYWLGRGAPEMLCAECLESLEVNDPYVPERMLAASYGVVMAKHVDLNDTEFVKIVLPTFSRKLFDLMFAVNAQYITSHILMREYAKRIIQIAISHTPQLFSVCEQQRLIFSNIVGEYSKWEEYEGNNDIAYSDSPFHMDFENYTLGSLVPKRNNYDFKNSEYKKIRSQILWRVKKLGWSSEQFKDVDSSISNERYRPRMGSDGTRVDRYGKKYSWIAYFEMLGYLLDQGFLENVRERTLIFDIDPSFPDPINKVKLIEDDFLGDTDISTQEWIKNGPTPNVAPYLQKAEVHQSKGPWVMLDGFVTNQDENRGRKLYCYIRSFLVNNREAESLYEYLSKLDLDDRWLPEKPTVNYTFAGEIPWCETFPEYEDDEFSFETKKKTVRVTQMEKEFYLDNKRLVDSELDLLLMGLVDDISDSNHKDSNEIDIDRITFREVPVEREVVERDYINFKTEIPVYDFNWETDKSTVNSLDHTTTLSPKIATHLNLVGQPQTQDLFTREGERATHYLFDQDIDFNNTQSFLYLRKGLLESYLQKNNLRLIWVIWGERELSTKQLSKYSPGSGDAEQLYKTFSYVELLE